MSTRSLQRYASLYNMPCYTIPFDVKNLWIEPDFDGLKDVIMETDKLHVHCLSGGVLQYSRLLTKQEVLKEKVASEFFDNPSHSRGMINVIHEATKLSPRACYRMADFLFLDAFMHATNFVKQPVTNGRVKRVVVRSRKDTISPPKNITEMIDNWNIDTVWENECTHLNSLKTHPDLYRDYINRVLS